MYEKPVNVYIHEIFKTPEKIEVLYHVTVQGKPVLATTAADDMTLVTDDEVVDALGYPFVIKAERKLVKEPNSKIFDESFFEYYHSFIPLETIYTSLSLCQLPYPLAIDPKVPYFCKTIHF